MAFPKHYSDEVLLAHLDGELSVQEDDDVQRHLKSCWECRTRASSIENQILAATSALAEQTFPGPGHLEKARQRLLMREAEYERSLQPVPLRRFPLGPVRRWQIAIPGFALLVLAISIGWMVRHDANQTKPRDLLGWLEGSERRLAGVPVHQVFHAEIREVRPQPGSVRKAVLEIWTEPESGRFAARWQDPGGTLRRGLWHTDNGRVYSFDGGRTVVATPISSPSPFPIVEIQRGGLRAQELESGLLEWIASRNWSPVTFASDLRTFVDNKGAQLQAEVFRDDKGNRTARLIATGESAGARVAMIVEIDERTGRPHVETVRFEDGRRVMELRLVVERSEGVSKQSLRPAVFEPYELPPPAVPATALLPRMSSPKTEQPIAVELPTLSDLTDLEIQVDYALHQTRACLGEQLEVTQKGNRVLLSGWVADEDRRAELVTAVSGLPAGEPMLEIRTFAEAPQPTLRTPTVQVAPRSAEFPLHDYLASHFGRDLQRSARFSNDVISAADSALAQAWALNRLRTRYDRLSPPVSLHSRRLLGSMIRDHENEARISVRTLRTLLTPVTQEWPADAPTRADRDTLAAMERANRLVHGLFAGASLSGQKTGDAVQELWHLLGNVEAGLPLQIGQEVQ